MLEVKKIFLFICFTGFAVLSFLTGYYVLKYPFGTKFYIHTNFIEDLYGRIPRWPITRETRENKMTMRKIVPSPKGKSTIEKAAFLADWVHHQLEYGHSEGFIPWDPLLILEKSKQGWKFLCDGYAAVFVAAANAYDLRVRMVEIVHSGGEGHNLAEVWLPEENKWALVDPIHNLYLERDDRPMSVLDGYYAAKEGFKGIIARQGNVTDSSLVFSEDYFKYFDIEKLSVFLRTDLISRPRVFHKIPPDKPQRVMTWVRGAEFKSPVTQGQLKSHNIKVFIFAFFMLLTGLSLGILTVRREKY